VDEKKANEEEAEVYMFLIRSAEDRYAVLRAIIPKDVQARRFHHSPLPKYQILTYSHLEKPELESTAFQSPCARGY
jgi:hypothetical protein